MQKLVIVQRIMNPDIPTQYVAINEAGLFVVLGSDAELIKVDSTIKNYSIHMIHNSLIFTPIRWCNIADITSGITGVELYKRLAAGTSKEDIARYIAYRWIEGNTKSKLVYKAIDFIMSSR